MKALMKTTVAAAVLATSMFANAAEAQQKVGFVDMQTVLQQLPQVQELSNRLQEEFAGRISELEKMRSDMQALSEKAERDAQIMSPSERRDLQREMEMLETQYQMKARAFQEDNERRGNEERNKLMREVFQIAQQVAQAEGFDLVLNSQSVLYAGESLNLTDEVVAKMTGGN